MNAVPYTDWSEYNYSPCDIVCKSTQIVVHKKSRDDWKIEQEGDSIIGPVIEAMKNKTSNTAGLSDESKQLFRNRSRLLFHCGLLYRKVFDGQLQENKFQFVLPQSYIIERTTSLLRDRFYWPLVIEDIELHIRSCPHCLRFKTQPERAELNPIVATRPMELVHIDYLMIEAPENSRSSKDINILIITDHFTRYAQAHITSSQKAHVVAKTLWEHFFVHYGFPEKILSDQGRNFESVLISELCELAQIKKLRTTPYRPEGNGSCERFNRTLISMLGTLPEEFKNKWPQHVSTLTYAYNCTRSNATGFSPYYLLHGRQPLLPIDIEYGVFTPELSEAVTYKYAQELKSRLEHAFNKANDFCEREAIRSKQRFDKTAKCSKLMPADLVLVKRKGFVTKHKIADKRETKPYEIVSQCSDGLPVYTVTRNGRERTLHRNMLFPLALRRDSGSILPSLAEFENTENPDMDQVDNFSNSDGEVGQPAYEGPQTRSHTRKLMKANCLMANLFDVESGDLCDEVSEVLTVIDESNPPAESFKNFDFRILVQTDLHVLWCLL